MRVAPHKLTHHHIKRLYHISMLSCWALILGSMLIGQLFVWIGVKAEDVGIVATVGEINPGPINSGGGGGGDYQFIPTAPTKFPPPEEYDPEVTIEPDNNEAQILTIIIDGRPQKVWVFQNQFPTFTGRTKIPNGIVFFEIHSDVLIKGSTFANSSGIWRWRSPEPVSPGPHEIFTAIVDAKKPNVIHANALKFIIDIPSGKVIEPLPPARSVTKFANKSENSLFDVLVKVPEQSREIEAGDNLVAALRFINFSSPGHPIDVVVEYSIVDANNTTILNSSETVAVGTQLSYLKSFYTSKTLKPGIYTLTIKVPSRDIITTSSDFFEIKEKPKPTIIGEIKQKFPISPNTMMILGLFVLFGLLFLWELRKISNLTKVIKNLQPRYSRLARAR